MYLGYNYQNQLSKLASRLTLKVQKEISINFFDARQVAVNGIEKDIQGIAIYHGGRITEDQLSEVIADLPCIFINKSQRQGEEFMLMIAQDPGVVQAWYDERREGSISKKVCEKFNYFNDPVDEDEVIRYRDELQASTPRLLV